MHGDSSGFQQTEDGKSLFLTMYAAKFKRTRTEVRLLDVNLTGGVTDLEVATEQTMPEGTSVHYEYQYDGVWRPLTQLDALVANLPSTVPMRAVFSGTTSMQPAIQTGADRITAGQAGTSLTHYSTLRQLPAASSEIYVDLDVAFFDDANESVTVSILDADNSLAETTASSTTVLRTQPVTKDDGTSTNMENRTVRFEFTPGTAVQNYHVKITGSTNSSAARPFVVAERTDSAVA